MTEIRDQPVRLERTLTWTAKYPQLYANFHKFNWKNLVMLNLFFVRISGN
jgi:hypothetical protein